MRRMFMTMKGMKIMKGRAYREDSYNAKHIKENVEIARICFKQITSIKQLK